MAHVTLLCILFLCSIICLICIRALYRRQQCMKRIGELVGIAKEEEGPRERRSLMRRWLALAGFRHASASLFFLGSMVASSWSALILLAVLNYLAIFNGPIETLLRVPSTFVHMVGLAGYGIPLLVFFLIAGMPIFVVRGARTKRIRQVEQDLPLFLDLLSTLAEAGMSFDLALGKILSSQPSARALSMEFRIFQREASLGISRLKCFRRLSQRLSIPSVSLFIVALIQSEQLGANVAETLRRQAEDLRHRRQEQAMLHAQGLSVKLVFPLVLCFLPGIFIATLGPTVYQLIHIVGGVTGAF